MKDNKESLNIHMTEQRLKELCVEFIGILDDVYNRGIITREEYLENIKLKKEFMTENPQKDFTAL